MELELLGYTWAFVTVLLWSINPALISIVSRRNASTWTIMFWRILTSLFILAPLSLMFNSPWPKDPAGYLWGFIASLSGPGAGETLYVLSIKNIGGGKAIAIGYLYVIIAQFIAGLWLREKITILLLIGAMISVAGVWLVSISKEEGSSHYYYFVGISAALFAAIFWAIASNLNKVALYYFDPLQLALYRNVLLLPIYFPIGKRYKLLDNFGRLEWGALIASGVLSLGLAIYGFLIATDIIGVSKTTLITSLAPVGGQLFSAIIAGEKLSKKQVLGAILTSAGVMLGAGF